MRIPILALAAITLISTTAVAEASDLQHFKLTYQLTDKHGGEFFSEIHILKAKSITEAKVQANQHLQKFRYPIFTFLPRLEDHTGKTIAKGWLKLE